MQQLLVPSPDTSPSLLCFLQQDTCDSIASLFGLDNATDLVSLNPALRCESLSPGLQICAARGDPYQLPVCTTFHSVLDGETCTSIMAAEDPPLTPFAFFSMNPGIMCDNLLPTQAGDGMPGQAVCVSSQPMGIRCPFKVYYVRGGDSCPTILARYFQPTASKRNIPAATLYYQLNGSYCVRIFIGYAMCLPFGVNP